MDTNDPKIMARLVALNARTRTAWAHPHNKSFYVPTRKRGFPEYDENRHESTPVHEKNDNDSDDKVNEPELRIRFDIRPKDISKGWMFGSDRSVCDIYCGADGGYGESSISKQTFLITMSKQGNVILKHIKDTNQTQAQYGNQTVRRRGKFVWTILPDCRSTFVISNNLLKFRILVTKPSHQTESYKAFRTNFLADIEKSLPLIPFLSVDNETTAADTSLVSTSETQPFYYRREEEKLGCGSYGEVFVVVDVSTTIEYAGKTFIGKFTQNEVEILAKQNHVSRVVCLVLVWFLQSYLSNERRCGNKMRKCSAKSLMVSAGEYS